MLPRTFERKEAVIDSSCLIHLWNTALVNKLTLSYRTIYIPGYVKEEVGRKGKLRHSLRELIDNYYPFLQICNIDNHYEVLILSDPRTNPKKRIDRGEAEVILQARDRGITNVLIDEKKGRTVAKIYSLSVTGTLGVIGQLRKEEYIDSVSPYLLKIGNSLDKISRKLRVKQNMLEKFLEDFGELGNFKRLN